MSLPPLPRPRQGNSCGVERDLSETLNYSWGPTALHPPLQLPGPECLLGRWGLLFLDKQGLTGASLLAQTSKNLPAMQETWVQSLGQKIPWRREWLLTSVFLPEESHGQRQAIVHGVANKWT